GTIIAPPAPRSVRTVGEPDDSARLLRRAAACNSFTGTRAMRIFAPAVAAVVVMSAAASAQTLSLGDNAPSLANTTWIQGDPVSHWEHGQGYVPACWAPWCGPCIASMPHVNELHRTYKDKGVTIIGVSIWPSENMTPTDEFVAEHVVNPDTGEKILYRIAED